MKAIALVSLASVLVVACATGTYGPGDTSSSHGDGGIVSKGDAGLKTGKDAGNPNTGDDASVTPPTCDQTLCGTDCVDTSSDPNNCGACNNPCDVSSTCVGGQCVPQTTGNEPPQGSCEHSLCSSGDALLFDCDTLGCTDILCDPDFGDPYCCDTAWDSQCVTEVSQACAPYSCN